MTLKIVREQPVLVVVGSFNPAIFHPQWFGRHGLLPDSEVEAAQIEIIHPDLAQFRAGAMQLLATRDRLQIETQDPSMQMPLRDLAVGVFRLLPHLPITSLGINRLTWGQIDDDERWHALGHALAPKPPWSGLLQQSGTQNVTMLSPRADELPGSVRVQFQPVFGGPGNVHLNINHHIDQATKGTTEAKPLLAVLEAHYERLQLEAQAFLPRLVSQALGESSV